MDRSTFREMLGTLLSADADVVIGSRYVVGASVGVMAVVPQAAVLVREAYVRSLLYLGIRDVTAGYKIWRASALEAMACPPSEQRLQLPG